MSGRLGPATKKEFTSSSSGSPRFVVSRTRLESELCRESLFDFVQRFWSTIINEKPVWNWHIEVICKELQRVAERVMRRKPKLHDLVINVSPGSTKSTICSVMFPAWCWTRDASFRLICGSYADRLAGHLGNQTKRIIESDKYNTLFPDVNVSREAESLIETSSGGQRVATSTGGSVTGLHGHCIVIDDPIKPDEALSEVRLVRANEWFDHTLMSRAVDAKITPLILIMQRLHENDPAGHVLARREEVPVRLLRFPAELDDRPLPRMYRKFYRDGLFDPVRLPLQIVRKKEMELGQYAFAGQYRQRPTPLGGGMFRVSAIEERPSALGMVRLVRYWDKAGTGGGGAWTVGLLMGLDRDGHYWILDVVRGQWEPAERERIIRATAERDGKNVQVAVEQEPGSGGKESAQATLKMLAGWRCELDKPTGDKVLRADPFAAQVNGGNVRLVRGDWTDTYLGELRLFPFSKYKDQVDASSGAFAILTGKRLRVGGF